MTILAVVSLPLHYTHPLPSSPVVLSIKLKVGCHTPLEGVTRGGPPPVPSVAIVDDNDDDFFPTTEKSMTQQLQTICRYIQIAVTITVCCLL